MAHKTLVGGTAYDVKGGKSLVGGTAYSIKKGRTLVGGTGYDISFAAPTVTLKLITNYWGEEDDGRYIDVGTTRYVSDATLQVPVGTQVHILNVARYAEDYGKTVSNSIYFNGTVMGSSSHTFNVTADTTITCTQINSSSRVTLYVEIVTS